MYATHERRWWTLGVLCLSLILIILGNTVLNVAIPTLQRELDATQTELQWIVDAYALVFAGLLLTGGALGDRFGRKGALQLGLVVFGVASLFATLAGEPWHLVAARAVMGVGSALVMPGTLSILTNVFPPHERARAIGIWAGLAGSGAAIGPVAGGWLVEHFGWNSVFLLNVVVVVVALVAGALLVPSSKDPDEAPLDPTGAFLSIAGLTALLYAIIEAPNHGWLAPVTIATFAAALALLGGFAWWELRTAAPMLDLRFFRNPRFSAASGAITVLFLVMFGMFFVMTQYLQFVRGYSAFEAGLRTLPAALAMMATAPQSQRVVARIGPRRTVTIGMTGTALSLALLSLQDLDTPYWTLGLTFLLQGASMGLIMPPATTSIMSTLPLGKAGVGSAVNDTTREVGGALGVAVLGSVLASRFSSTLGEVAAVLPEPLREAATSSVGAAVTIGREVIGGPAGQALDDAARAAFVDGMEAALVIGAVLMLAGTAVVARFFPAHAEEHPFPPMVPAEPDVDGPEVSVAGSG